MNWIEENKEWIFSGIGAVVIGTILTLIFKSKGKNKKIQTQKSGKDSINLQSGRDIRIGDNDKR